MQLPLQVLLLGLEAWPNGNSQIEEQLNEAESWAESFESLSGEISDIAERVGAGETEMDDALDELDELVSCLECP